MTSPDVHTMTGGYAADALEDDERLQFEEHLAGCPECRAEVLGLRETLARLGQAVARSVPPGLKERVLAQVAITPQLPPLIRPAPAEEGHPVTGRTDGPGAPAGPPLRWPGRLGRTGTRLLVAAASVLLALAGALGVQHARQHGQPPTNRTAAAIARVTSDPAAVRHSVRVGDGTATLVVATAGVVLQGDRLPALGADRSYQIWVIRPGQGLARSVGLAPPSSGTPAPLSWARLIPDAGRGDTVAISVEPFGGSAQPSSAPVAALRI